MYYILLLTAFMTTSEGKLSTTYRVWTFCSPNNTVEQLQKDINYDSECIHHVQCLVETY